MKKEDDKKKYIDSIQQAGQYLGLGTQLTATILLMFFFGRWLDSKLHTTPFLILLFTFIGATAGFYNFIKTVLQINKRQKRD
jgi:F0F1-type ATP synthase assembly protein I